MLRFRYLTIGLLLSLPMLVPGVGGQTPSEYHTRWGTDHLTRIDPSKVRHRDLLVYLNELKVAGVKVDEVGRSLAGRGIYQLEFGRGPVRVFLWSQMHGDEPTATSALVDLFYYWQTHREEPAVAEMARTLTIRAVPMLNPDGVELFQRRNLQSIDINRDARRLVTPEGRLLKRLRDEWEPVIGFNLHNQNIRTAVGETGRQAVISLLAVAHDEARRDNPARMRAKKVCSTLFQALSGFIPGQIGRYDDTFNPRAFGDLISQWGTPVVLIETGGWYGRPEMDLVRLNFTALAWTLQELARGGVERGDPAIYDSIPFNNSGGMIPLIVRGATIVNRYREGSFDLPPFAADIAVNVEGTRATIQDLGDLEGFAALDVVDARGFHVTVARGTLRTGGEAALLFYKSSRQKTVEWSAPDLEVRFPPDAIFRQGRWTGREKLEKN
ncbi:MAG: M14 family zinc carboxypeptidase [Blastocatellia bacterium]